MHVTTWHLGLTSDQLQIVPEMALFEGLPEAVFQLHDKKILCWSVAKNKLSVSLDYYSLIDMNRN